MNHSSLIKTPYGKKYSIGADCTASGAVYPPIEKIIQNHIHRYYSNTHSNAHNGKLMAHYLQQAKEIIRKSVNGHPDDEIIFTGNGCSGAISHLIHSLGLRHKKDKIVVFVSVAEHHSNYLPWTHLSVALEIIPLTSKGTIDLTILKTKIKEYPHHRKIGSFIAGSNVTGVLQPVHQLARIMHKSGGIILLDYAASAPYVPIDLHHDQDSYFDAIFISPHKFLGGPGSPGLLIANHRLFLNEEPYCPGGGTVRFVCRRFTEYSKNLETRESGGTPNIIGGIRAGLAFQLKDLLLPIIIGQENRLVSRIRESLLQIKNLSLINPLQPDSQLPIFSFTIKGLHYNFIVALLNDLFGIQSRGGVSCCSVFAQYLLRIGHQQQEKIHQQILSDKGVPKEYGWCRVTFHYLMSEKMIDYILASIAFVADHGHRFLPEYHYLPKKNHWQHLNFNDKFPVLSLEMTETSLPVKLTHKHLVRQFKQAEKQLKIITQRSIPTYRFDDDAP